MFTIIAGSEFMIAVIVVKSESSKTLVTLSLSLDVNNNMSQVLPGHAGHRSSVIGGGYKQQDQSHSTVQAASGLSQGQPGSCDANV